MTSTEAKTKKPRRANGAAHLRPDGRWETAVWDPETRKWKSVYGRTKADATKKADAERRKIEAGTSLAGGRTKVGALMDLWLERGLPARSRVKSPNTITNYRWALCLARPYIGTKTLDEISVEDVERMLSKLADEGMARNSIVRVRSVLSTVFRWAQKRRWTSWNPAELAEMPAHARAVKEGRSLTDEQARALLRAAEGHDLAALVAVGVMLGLRPGELCGLRWSDVDLDAGVLHIRQARKREHINGVETLTFGEPKTKKSQRTLSMPAPVITALRKHSSRQAAIRLSVGERWQDFDLVFPTSVGSPMNPANLRRDFGKLTESAGLGRWSPKELRHSAGSLLSAAGVPLEEIADLLGHTDTRMLERVYRHRVKPSVDAAVAPMAVMFGGVATDSAG